MSHNELEQSYKETAQKILDHYKQCAQGTSGNDNNINSVNELSIDTGLELVNMLDKSKCPLNPLTEWNHQMYCFASLLKDLIVLIGKPGMLKKLHPSNRKHASERLMRMHNFFMSVFDHDTTKDWLTWVILDQYSGQGQLTESDQTAIIRNLKVNK